MSFLPLLLKATDSNIASSKSHLDRYKYALSNLVTNIEDDGLLLSINVKDFEPSEVTVTTLDNTIIVEGNHKDPVNTHNSRHFIRKYTLPATTIDINDMTTFSSDGLFTIYVPPKLKSFSMPSPSRIQSTEDIVPIEHTSEQTNKLDTNNVSCTEHVIPIQLTEELFKSPAPRTVKQQTAVVRTKKPKILRFENIQDSNEDIKEEFEQRPPDKRLIKRKVYCCCQ